jgi:hypothetical protein
VEPTFWLCSFPCILFHSTQFITAHCLPFHIAFCLRVKPHITGDLTVIWDCVLSCDKHNKIQKLFYLKLSFFVHCREKFLQNKATKMILGAFDVLTLSLEHFSYC